MTRESLAETRQDQGSYNFHGAPWPGLSKLIEECGEVIQIAGKLMATNGEAEHWSENNLYARLEEEIGDVLAAVGFLVDHNARKLVWDNIDQRRADKRHVFERWHRGAD